MTVEGENLESVADHVMEVTMVHTKTINNKQTVIQEKKFTSVSETLTTEVFAIQI